MDNQDGSMELSSSQELLKDSQTSTCSLESIGIPPSLVNDGLQILGRSLHEQFDQFEKIGEGGFGEVFKARHKLDCQYYAIKKIPISSTREKDCCLKEVKIMAQLSHKNVVAYKNAWMEPFVENESESSESCESSTSKRGSSVATDDVKIPKMTFYIQMELCIINLKTFLHHRNIENKSSTPRQVYNMGSQILKGLIYIHKLKILHHDINPANIFITKTGNKLCFKIGDFGLSCSSLKVTHNEKFGTVIYAAPEQIKNKICDFKSDIFSFGMVLLEILHPMKSKSELCKIKQETIEKKFPSELHEELKTKYCEWAEVLVKALQVDADRRPPARNLLKKVRKWILKESFNEEKEDKRNLTRITSHLRQLKLYYSN